MSRKKICKKFRDDGTLSCMALLLPQGIKVRMFDADGTESVIESIQEMSDHFLIAVKHSDSKPFYLSKADLGIKPPPDLKKMAQQIATKTINPASIPQAFQLAQALKAVQAAGYAPPEATLDYTRILGQFMK